EYVGHPLPDELDRYPKDDGEALRRELTVPDNSRVIGIFPGSRTAEVEQLTRDFCQLAREVSPAFEGVSVVASCFRETFREKIETAAKEVGVPLTIYEGDARRLMMASDLALVASGTASLELAYFETPMIVCYRTTKFGLRMFNYFRVTPWFTLPNIVGASVTTGQDTVSESLYWGELGPEIPKIAKGLLWDGEERDAAIERLRRLKQVLTPGGIDRAASALENFLRAAGLSSPTRPE
ncbi:MAG: hypothetical protein AAF488_18210, partial [Planctomycetota bacterium]